MNCSAWIPLHNKLSTSSSSSYNIKCHDTTYDKIDALIDEVENIFNLLTRDKPNKLVYNMVYNNLREVVLIFSSKSKLAKRAKWIWLVCKPESVSMFRLFFVVEKGLIIDPTIHELINECVCAPIECKYVHLKVKLNDPNYIFALVCERNSDNHITTNQIIAHHVCDGSATVHGWKCVYFITECRVMYCVDGKHVTNQTIARKLKIFSSPEHSPKITVRKKSTRRTFFIKHTLDEKAHQC